MSGVCAASVREATVELACELFGLDAAVDLRSRLARAANARFERAVRRVRPPDGAAVAGIARSPLDAPPIG